MGFLTEVSGPPITDTPSARWIFERIEEWAARSPDRLAFAVDHQDKVEEYRYGEVLKHADAIAGELAARGIKPGDRIGILMENVPQWVLVLLGAMKAGAVTVPLATLLPESSLQVIGKHAGCRLIFSDATNWDKAARVAGMLGCPVLPASEIRDSRFEIRNFPAPSGDDTAILIYTSGTTGDPKGVELTFKNLVHEIQSALESLEISSDHRILSVLPFSHVLPLIANGLGPLCMGAGVVFLTSISPQRIIDAFHRHRITFFICVPQFFYIFHTRIFTQVASQPFSTRLLFRLMKTVAHRLKSPALRRKLFAKVHKSIGPELRLLASGGSHFDKQVGQDLNDLGYVVLQAYGLTETSAAATVTPVDDNRIGTVGKPIRGVTVRIDSPNEGGIGEVWIRGPVVMKGYYRDAEQTSQAIKDGWFHTGDL